MDQTQPQIVIEKVQRLEQSNEDYLLILTTGRVLYHYHTGTMTRRSEGFDWHESRGYAKINSAGCDGD